LVVPKFLVGYGFTGFNPVNPGFNPLFNPGFNPGFNPLFNPGYPYNPKGLPKPP